MTTTTTTDDVIAALRDRRDALTIEQAAFKHEAEAKLTAYQEAIAKLQHLQAHHTRHAESHLMAYGAVIGELNALLKRLAPTEDSPNG